MRPFSPLIVALFWLLSACNGDNIHVPPTPVLAWQADFTGPTIVGGYCTGDVPPVCNVVSPYQFGTFQPPQGNTGCDQPGPNSCYSITTPGALDITALAGQPGSVFISTETFPVDKTITIKATTRATCNETGCWGGIVLYDGDAVSGQPMATGRWRGIYYSWVDPLHVQLGMWGPTHLQLFPMIYAAGSAHDLEMVYIGGTWQYIVDGAQQSVVENDPTLLTNDPHAALFMGSMQFRATDFKVYMGL